jgi:hypothetical protein
MLMIAVDDHPSFQPVPIGRKHKTEVRSRMSPCGSGTRLFGRSLLASQSMRFRWNWT